MTKTKVVHCKKEKFDIYIGRPSPYGNPFTHKQSALAEEKVGSREEAIKRYRKWIMKPEQVNLRNRMKTFLKGRVLACWCKPRACHGDVIAKICDSK